MLNELRYRVGSREIIDLFSSMKSGRLILSPYFQRNLVWRDTHRREFIDTIIKGFPFPQIFLARGPINLETMQAYQCVVDGQQRLNAIRDFIEGKIDVGGKLFSDFSQKEKEEFLKYEVAVIDFDLDNDDDRLKDIFHRLNRTYYSLSAIERLASEYSASEFLLVARVLCGEITNSFNDAYDEMFAESEELEKQENRFSRDPGVGDEMWQWLLDNADGKYSILIQDRKIFSPFEFDRKIPLMFTLNLMCTYLVGYYNRNDKVRRFLEDKNAEFSEKSNVIEALNNAASFVSDLGFDDGAIWWSKANFFTLVSEVARSDEIRSTGLDSVRERLRAFAANLPQEYALAAREGVGRKSQREFRGRTLRAVALGHPWK